MVVLHVFRLSRTVLHVRAIGTWKVAGYSAPVARLLSSARQLSTQDDKDTSFEKVRQTTLVCIRRGACFLYILQENIFTVPNVLSLGRIALSPALGYFVLSENYKLALTFFVLAGVSDLVGKS